MPRQKRERRNFGVVKCKECSKEVTKKRRTQEFCSTKCRVNNWMKNHPRMLIQVKVEKEKS
jgi:endogenous inhibitor of DNA gyrase (YacG/DUF329 family)